MGIYAGTLGELIIVELFVFFIWLRVLVAAVRSKEDTVAQRRFLLTSLGLVFNAAAIAGIMTVRVYQLLVLGNPFSFAILLFYGVLAVGNILFIVAACIGRSATLLKAFVVVTILWTAYVCFASYF